MPASIRLMWHGPDHREPVRLPGLEHRVPHLHAVARRVLEVDLVPELARVARPRDDEIHPVELVAAHEVVGDVDDRLAEEVDHDVLRLRPLHLERPDVRLADLHVEPGVLRDPPRPEQDVAVGEREPEAVLLEPQEHRVVQDPALVRGDEDVLALPDLALGQVARHEHVRERERVRPGDLDLALDPDVPQRHAVQEIPVLLDRVAVVPGVVHVVVEAVLLDPVPPRRVEVRRLADARVEQDFGVLVDLAQGVSPP